MSLAPIGRPKKIFWSLTSKKDPRWDASDKSTVAMIFQTAPNALNHIKRMKEKYGKMPDDLEYNGHKH